MISSIDVNSWRPYQVKDWLSGLCDDSTWMKADYILNNNVNGRQLLISTADDLYNLGATTVNLQEHILEAIERLRFYNNNIHKETLQDAIMRLASQSRSLQMQLVANRTRNENSPPNPKVITLSRDFVDNGGNSDKQRVDLDTLSSVSAIVKTVKEVTEMLNRMPFSDKDEYRSMRSLILALSIELTSTAQRDQFVDRPNDILEKSSKALADYCDRNIYVTIDTLTIEPFQVRAVTIRRDPISGLGISIKSEPGNVHRIDHITPFSSAKKTNELHEGDEVIHYNQLVIGWTAKKLKLLMESVLHMKDITLIVKKDPIDSSESKYRRGGMTSRIAFNNDNLHHLYS